MMLYVNVNVLFVAVFVVHENNNWDFIAVQIIVHYH